MPFSREAAEEISNGGAVAIRCDKDVYTDLPRIGLAKKKNINRQNTPFITCSTDDINSIAEWADYVAIDYRRINKGLSDISNYCRKNGIHVIADIGDIDDYKNIKELGLKYDYIATTLSVLRLQSAHLPDIVLVEQIAKTGEKMLIAEGNYTTRAHVKAAYDAGASNVCCGQAITNLYKLTRKYSTVTKTRGKHGNR